MKILALVEDLRINKTSAGIRRANILKVILSDGHEIRCVYDYFDDDGFPWLKSTKISFIRIENFKDHISVRYLKKIPKSNQIVSHVKGFNFDELNKIESWKKTITKELNDSFNFILVLGAGNSNYNFFAVSDIKTTIPYIVNYHDPYPITQYPEPYAIPSTYIFRLKTKKSNEVIKNAFKVTFPSQRLFEWMSKFHPILAEKSFILPHVYTQLENLPTSRLDSEVNFDPLKFNVLHLGSLLGPRNPKYLIEAFIKFVEEDPVKKKMAILNIIGSVAKENREFDQMIDNDSIRIIKERISYKKSIDLLNTASVLLILEAKAINSPFMPGKLADYIAARKPILALTPDFSETSRILGENYEFKTEMDNVDQVYNLLVKLWDKWYANEGLIFYDENLLHYISPSNFNMIFNSIIKPLND